MLEIGRLLEWRETFQSGLLGNSDKKRALAVVFAEVQLFNITTLSNGRLKNIFRREGSRFTGLSGRWRRARKGSLSLLHLARELAGGGALLDAG
jgi:hypothetical protein